MTDFFLAARRCWLALLVCASAIGCGGPRVVPVSGVVTHAGKPLPDLVVHFQPAEGDASWGTTDDEGRFTLTYRHNAPGALTGMHTVWIEYDPMPSDPMDSIRVGLDRLPPRPREIDALLKRFGQAGTSSKKVEIKQAEERLEVQLD